MMGFRACWVFTISSWSMLTLQHKGRSLPGLGMREASCALRDGSARLRANFYDFLDDVRFWGSVAPLYGSVCLLETSVITIVPRAPGQGSVGVECLRRARGRGRVASAR
mmetsp:Transcript_33164/g.102771  ORF Transcript_33164/g.102771 Transcript_33164/m.102771 type:complete len:109 (-) Transcript_33164:41-367(-)